MKSLSFIFIALLGFSVQAQAQEWDAPAFVQKIFEAPVLGEVREFKANIEGRIEKNAPALRQNAQIRQSYEQTREALDEFLVLVQQDVLDFRRIRQVGKKNKELSPRYAEAWNKLVKNYDQGLSKDLAALEGKDRNFLKLLSEYGPMIFDFIGDVIKDRKLKKGLLREQVLKVLSPRFDQELKLRPWAELVGNGSVKAPDNGRNNPSQPSSEALSGRNKDQGRPESSTASPRTGGHKSAGLSQSKPLVRDIEAEVQLLYSYKNQSSAKSQPMRFSLPQKSRTLGIGGLSSEGREPSPYSLASEEAYGDNIGFQIKVQSPAFVYAFALNEERGRKKALAIYPFSKEWVSHFRMSKSRTLDLGPLMLRDEDDRLTIPSANAETGEENYILVSGNSPKEEFCVLLSRVELDFEAFCRELEQAEGNMQERVEAILGTRLAPLKAASPQTDAQGRIQVLVEEEQYHFLPLYFELRRQ